MNTGVIFGILIVFIFVGLCFAGVLSGIIYASKKKSDPNMTYRNAFSELAFPSILSFIAISFLIIIKYNFNSPVQIVFMSALIIAGFFASIETKNAVTFFVLLGVVIFYLGTESVFKVIKKNYSNKLTKIPSSYELVPIH